ncbi:MAG: caspase family protein [Rhodospirillales bacterium]
MGVATRARTVLAAGTLAGACAALCSIAVLGGALAAENRLALVIGNSGYRHTGKLTNPANDARLVSAVLVERGFRLIGNGPQLDLDRVAMERAIREFGRSLSHDAVGLVFYAGHGLAVKEVNYLMPVDANPVREADVDFELIDSRLIIKQMASAGNRLNMLILDACRNNPLLDRGFRSAGRGLARMEGASGTLVAFSTQPGNVAKDGDGRNSPYALAFMNAVRQPMGLLDVFNRVGIEVRQATRGEQEPWLAVSPIEGQFYFTPPAPSAAPPAVAAAPQGSVMPALPGQGPPAYAPPALAMLPRTGGPLEPIDREYVARESARVRADPDVNAGVVATLRQGETVLVLGKVRGDSWYQVELKDKSRGFVAESVLEEQDAFKNRQRDNRPRDPLADFLKSILTAPPESQQQKDQWNRGSK